MNLLGINLSYYYRLYFIAIPNFQHSLRELLYYITKLPRKFRARALDLYQEGGCIANKNTQRQPFNCEENKTKPYKLMLWDPIVK